MDETKYLQEVADSEYEYGFVTEIDSDTAPKGLTEDTVRLISSKKDEPEWMLEWRLRAFRHWQKLAEPHWANISYEPIDYQDISYYSAPKMLGEGGPSSLDDETTCRICPHSHFAPRSY